MEIEWKFASATGLGDVYSKQWKPDSSPIAIVQIAHGMAEHIGRYSEFIGFLNENSVLVVANDHAGHGGSISENGVKGYFGAKNGWDFVIEDMRRLHDEAVSRYPNVPYVLLGHSMGSFLARTYAARYGKSIAAFVFSGTAGRNPAIGAGRIAGRLERMKNGPAAPSKLLDKLSFGAYNKAFAPARTSFDWLSRDTERVNEYIADPLCGFVFTAEGMLDIFDGLEFISSPEWASSVPHVPILMISGEHDPVGNNGKGVRQVAAWLSDTGHDVELKLYPEGRHEMLNEVNRKEVYSDILAFIKRAISG